MKKLVLGLVGFLSMLGATQAALGIANDSASAYIPTTTVSGDIRIWGCPADRPLLKDWETGFRKFHPDAHLVLSLHGPDSTMAGIYTGVADLALMERELKLPVENMAFTWVYLYPPYGVEIANAGLKTDRLGVDLAVFVNRANPLSRLTLTQLDAVLGAEHRRGATNIRTWGELGLGEPWVNRPIHVYGPAVDSVPALYIRRTVLKDSYKWNPDYREFVDDDGRESLAAVAGDPDGIAYAPLRAVADTVKPLALAAEAAGPFVDLTPASAVSRDYPLTRAITMMLNRAPGKPIDLKIKEFLRFVLSRDGQAAIARDGAYLPLNSANLREQSARLD